MLLRDSEIPNREDCVVVKRDWRACRLEAGRRIHCVFALQSRLTLQALEFRVMRILLAWRRDRDIPNGPVMMEIEVFVLSRLGIVS